MAINVIVQYNGGCLPDILLLIQADGNKHIYIYTKFFELSRASISNPCSLVALELFFCDFSVPRPLPALILAARGSPRQ